MTDRVVLRTRARVVGVSLGLLGLGLFVTDVQWWDVGVIGASMVILGWAE